MIDTIVKNAFIVTLLARNNERDAVKVLWGIVADDPSGRWNSGDYCCSTNIFSIEGDQVTTKNSVYQVLGEATTVELGIDQLLLLRQGLSPAECLAIQRLK